MFGRSTAPQQVPSLPASDVIERWVIRGFGSFFNDIHNTSDQNGVATTD
jgi:hypothetical protein